jgi:hypothetical protein
MANTTSPTQPAPQDLAQDPEFVVEGRWGDDQWREVARLKPSQRTRVQEAIFQAGPRKHPWGPHVHRAKGKSDTEYAGQHLIFPSKAAHDEYYGRQGQEGSAPELRSEHSKSGEDEAPQGKNQDGVVQDKNQDQVAEERDSSKARGKRR